MIAVVVLLLCTLPCVLSQVEGKLRLVAGNVTGGLEGRVEIFHNNKWGTICDDYWSIDEANVVCRQLGHRRAHYSYCCAHFGRGNGTIWMDDVRCIGNESAITECVFNGWSGHNCRHREDVGVACMYEGNITVPGNCNFEKGNGMCGYEDESDQDGDDLMWMFGSRQVPGWTGTGPKFDHTTGNTTANGFYLYLPSGWSSRQGQAGRIHSPIISSASCLSFYYYMEGSAIGELNVIMRMKDSSSKLIWSLTGDQKKGWKQGVVSLKGTGIQVVFEGVAGTGYFGDIIAIDDISVTNDAKCSLMPAAALPQVPVNPKSTIRLVGPTATSIKSAGRVEVYHTIGNDSYWGTICDYNFDITDAEVVCKQLGYEGAEMVVPCCDVFSKGSGRIWLDDVNCGGGEPVLSMCPHSGWGMTRCRHEHDVGVICKSPDTDRTDFKVKLVNDDGIKYKGRVEIEIGGLWGTVTDEGWDMYDANVACRELGFGGVVGVYSGSTFGPGTGPVWMSDFRCDGSETSLSKCDHNDTRVYEHYGHYRDASAECYGLRLAGGVPNTTGRVEVMYDGKWGTVCDHGWDLNAANVVCRQLGFKRAESASFGASFGQGSGQILLDHVKCKGDEASLSFCRHMGWTAHNCSHNNDAGVFCTNALCDKNKPCSNGGTCSNSMCTCSSTYAGESCQLFIGNDTMEVVLSETLQEWNETKFKRDVVKELNTYCAKVNCSLKKSPSNNGGKKFKVILDEEDIVITEAPKAAKKGIVVKFAVLFMKGVTVDVLPRSVVSDLISQNGDKLAGFKVLTFDGHDEPAAHGSGTQKKADNSTRKYIIVGCGVAVGLIVVLVLVFVVRRYKNVLAGRGRPATVPSDYGEQSYLALNTEAYDDSMDDTALLRPPTEGDLIS